MDLRQRVQPLHNEGRDIVDHQLGPPVVGEARRHPPRQVQLFVSSSEQRDPAIRGDHAAREIGLDAVLGKAFGGRMAQVSKNTPRHTPWRSLDGHKSLQISDLKSTSLPAPS